MEKLLLNTGNSAAVITMLLLFIAGLLTKRFVPWWVYEDVLKKLKEYEDAAPSLISEIRRLMTVLDAKAEVEGDVKLTGPIKETEKLAKLSDKVEKHE